MVYYYEIVTKPLVSECVHGETCPICEKKDSIYVTLYMRYISALIPMFGMGRVTGVQCKACTHVLKHPGAAIFAKKNYSAEVDTVIKELRKNHKRTLWQLIYPWSFWLAILILAGVGYIYSQVRNYKTKQTQEILSHPQPGDIYKSIWSDEEASTGVGVLVKVVRVDGDTLFVVHTTNSIPFSYHKKDWSTLSTSDASFDNKQYKLNLPSFTRSKSYMEYGDINGNKRSVYRGSIVGKGHGNFDFDVIERKK